MRREDHFENAIDGAWHVTQTGNGLVMPSPNGLRLVVPPTFDSHYSNAQISDYVRPTGEKARFDFIWRPPLRMTVMAWAQVEGKPSDALRGTAGFGFWNHPFSPDVSQLPRLPRALWFFFASRPSNMQLTYDVPGHGWKAATIDATRKRALLLAPLALPAALLLRMPSLYRRLWKPIQRALQIDERLLDVNLLAQRHTYAIEWRMDGASFQVDAETLFETPFAPRGPAGFVAWLDNQYAVVTPQGRFGFGVVPIEHQQTLMLEHVLIEPIG
jgi:hypothetical protein